MHAQVQTLCRLRRPAFRPIRSRSRIPTRYGFREEQKLRCGLRGDKRLAVHHTEELDEIYKLDAVVRDLDAPHLPAVGVQFTTKHDLEKEERTLDAVRRHRVVVRLLYLIAECPLEDRALPIIRDMVRQTARQPATKALIVAVLATDEKGDFFFRKREELPLETKGTKKTHKEQGTKSDETKDIRNSDSRRATSSTVRVRAKKRIDQDRLSSREGRHVFKLVRLRLAESVSTEPANCLQREKTDNEPGHSDRRNGPARVVGRRPDSQGGGKVWRVERAA